MLSCFPRVQLFVTLWTLAHQVPLSMGFSRQEYWSGLPFPLPGDLPNPGMELESPALAGGFFITEQPGKSKVSVVHTKYTVTMLKAGDKCFMKKTYY